MAASPYRTTQHPGAPAAQPTGGGMAGTLSKLVLGLGCGCCSAVTLVMFLFLVWLGSLPESGAVPGGQMRPESVEHLRSLGLVEEGERVIYYYDYSMTMDDSEACFFSDRQVVYHREGVVNAIPWDEVEGVDAWEDFGQVIEVQSTRGDYLRCEIAAMNDGEAFYRALSEQLERQAGER